VRSGLRLGSWIQLWTEVLVVARSWAESPFPLTSAQRSRRCRVFGWHSAFRTLAIVFESGMLTVSAAGLLRTRGHTSE
jgi:hypothetical protein